MPLLTELKDFYLCVFYKYITPSGLKILNLMRMPFIPLFQRGKDKRTFFKGGKIKELFSKGER